ncbi:glycogen [starch] synthase, muscle [Sphaeroforma arctica JP610]|uniref:Glycogen [starch] synthase n=1 Tax=Sphaeroforma arctica JP610 TaxID=667725 RepID=A0A0L0G9J4_9EUKA|nr:glycogen [starch] synthase, muscle [Sphaeroforma arctica JP610]KNC85556.1 glycogen [starch] synthase, muscle [Sphaeroforma arctica JP610]|eukprot:XP_014159458.1 glycogen [starch] synthase, muscle [Sphaeroforma arctica JP610]
MPYEHNVPVFEIAWEVANKVGGIYTVIATKAGVSVKELGDRYFCIGLVNHTQIETEVDQHDLKNANVMAAVESIRSQGINVVTGRWLVDGYPQCILFDLATAGYKLNDWKYDLFEKCKIELPDNDLETNDATLFGNLTVQFLQHVSENGAKDGEFQAIAHFHEWLVGVGLILARTNNVNVATLFTTHATLLGRYLCAGNVDMYNNLSTFDCDAEAGKRGIYHRYCIERAATHCAHVFTTVSDITGDEATHLLKRKPDVLTPNGLNVKKFAALHEFQNLHQQSKAVIQQFVRGHFHGMLDFDMDKTLFFFLAGRYEFRNKGCDVFIEALARLNYELQEMGSDKTVVAFIVMSGKVTSFNVDALEGQAIAKQVEAAVEKVKGSIGVKLLKVADEGRIPDDNDIHLDKRDIMELKKAIYSSRRKNLPPVVTHDLVDDKNDEVLENLRRVKLFNNKHDRVKMIFHPQFLSSTSPILPLDYDGFVRGCHLGVFPSYYEPWGYTPAECTVMGVPSITSNLAGFGGFIEHHVPNFNHHGTFVVDRRFKSADESVNQLKDYMKDFCIMDRRERIVLRNRVERLSDLLDWKSLGDYYRYARQLALHHKYNYPLEGPPTIENRNFGDTSGKLPEELKDKDGNDKITLEELRDMMAKMMRRGSMG